LETPPERTVRYGRAGFSVPPIIGVNAGEQLPPGTPGTGGSNLFDPFRVVDYVIPSVI